MREDSRLEAVDADVISCLEIVQFRPVGSALSECVVRCLSGTLRIGDVVSSHWAGDGTEVVVCLEVSRILRYGQDCDLLDPPHNAMLNLVGALPYDARFPNIHPLDRLTIAPASKSRQSSQDEWRCDTCAPTGLKGDR